MNKFFLPSLALPMILLVGCETTEIREEQVSQRQDLQKLEDKISDLRRDVQSARTENEDLSIEIERLREDLKNSQGSNQQYEKDIKRLDELLKKLDTAREQDRKIIVEEVGREISRISQGISSTPIPDTGSAGSKEEGVEHVVRKGETLSAIARAYGVSIKSIQSANKLSKTELKVGQKLFIPKSK